MKPGVKFLVFASPCLILTPLARKIFFPPFNYSGDLEKKTIVVTGATGNLGTVIASHLAHNGQRVIMACRDMDKCKSIRREIVYRTNNSAVVCRYVDLTSLKSIDEFVKNIEKTEPRLDVLINCAAITKPPKEKQLTEHGIEQTFFVNYLVPFILSHKFIDKLNETAKITKDSRIINITGKPTKDYVVYFRDLNFDRIKYHPDKAFKQSKLALAYFTQMLDQAMAEQKKDIYVFGTNPGYKKLTDCNLRETSLIETLKINWQDYTRGSVDTCSATTVRTALDDKLGNRKVSGRLAHLFGYIWDWKQPANDLSAAKVLWNRTIDIIANLRNN